MALTLAVWWKLAAFATLWTLGYVYRPRERVTFTSALATASWALVALTGGNVVEYTQAGVGIQTDLAAFQYTAAGLAILSFLVLLLYRFGLYPPQETDAYEDTQRESTFTNPDP